MGSLQVQVEPFNPGDVTVRVWMSQYPPTGTPIDQTFIVNSGNPLNQIWQLDPGLYSVNIPGARAIRTLPAAAAQVT